MSMDLVGFPYRICLSPTLSFDEIDKIIPLHPMRIGNCTAQVSLKYIINFRCQRSNIQSSLMETVSYQDRV